MPARAASATSAASTGVPARWDDDRRGRGSVGNGATSAEPTTGTRTPAVARHSSVWHSWRDSSRLPLEPPQRMRSTCIAVPPRGHPVSHQCQLYGIAVAGALGPHRQHSVVGGRRSLHMAERAHVKTLAPPSWSSTSVPWSGRAVFHLRRPASSKRLSFISSAQAVQVGRRYARDQPSSLLQDLGASSTVFTNLHRPRPRRLRAAPRLAWQAVAAQSGNVVGTVGLIRQSSTRILPWCLRPEADAQVTESSPRSHLSYRVWWQ